MKKYLKKGSIVSVFMMMILLLQGFTVFAEDTSYSNMSSTPNNTSVTTIWNSMYKSGVDAFYSKLHTVSNSSYLKSTTIDGKTENYYLMEIKVHSSWESGKRYTIYTDTTNTTSAAYKYIPYYSNGYYTTWYPSGYSFKDGIFVIPSLYYQKNSYSNYYYYFKLYDLFYNKDYSFSYMDLNSKPYFSSSNLTNDARILYGRACWYSDLSGSNTLTSINRKTGNKVTSNSIYFKSNSEFENGILMNDNTYAFISSIKGISSSKYVSGYTLFIIDPDTLGIKNSIPLSKSYSLSLSDYGNLILKNSSDSLIISGTTLNITDTDSKATTGSAVNIETTGSAIMASSSINY